MFQAAQRRADCFRHWRRNTRRAGRREEPSRHYHFGKDAVDRGSLQKSSPLNLEQRAAVAMSLASGLDDASVADALGVDTDAVDAVLEGAFAAMASSLDGAEGSAMA